MRTTLALFLMIAFGATGAARALDQSQAVYCVNFSPDGKHLLSGGAARRVQLWDVETGKELKSFPHPAWVHTVAISPDGKYGVSGSRGCQMRLWDLTGGKMVHALNHRGWVVCGFFSPDGKTCVSVGGNDAKAGKAGIRSWNVKTGRQTRHLRIKAGDPLTYTWGALSADGKVLATGGDGVTIWDFEKGEVLRRLKGHTKSVWKLALSRDGATCVSAAMDNTARVWSVKDGRCLATLKHSRAVRAVAISPDGKLLATGGIGWVVPRNVQLRRGRMKIQPNYLIRLWDLRTYRELRRIEAHKWIVESLDFSPDGKTLVSGSFDGTVKLWNVGTGKLVRSFDGKQKSSASENPDARQQLAGAEKRIAEMTRKFQEASARSGSPRRGKGRVIGFAIDDRTGKVPAGLTIVGSSGSRTVRAKLESGQKLRGFYELALDPGLWKVEVRAPGYRTVAFQNVPVRPGHGSGMGTWRVFRLGKERK